MNLPTTVSKNQSLVRKVAPWFVIAFLLVERLKWSHHYSNWARDAYSANVNQLASEALRTAFVKPTTKGLLLVAEQASNRTAKVAYVTYAHLTTTERFDKNIFPALQLWHPKDQPYYVVLSKSWKEKYEDLVLFNETFKEFSSRIEMIWVDCGDGYMDKQMFCCKQENGMIAMLDHHMSKYDYLFYADDDNYIRASYVEKYLALQDENEVFVMTQGNRIKALGLYGVLGHVAPYKCSKDTGSKYSWGQAIIYSKGALKKIEKGLRLGGLTKQCKEYNVAQDVGNAIFNWMYEIPEKWNKITERCHDTRADYFGCHGVGRKDGTKKFDAIMAKRKTMFDVHEEFTAVLGERPLDINFLKAMRWRFRGGAKDSGFQRTVTFKEFGHPSTWESQWHTMPVSDCRKGPFEPELIDDETLLVNASQSVAFAPSESATVAFVTHATLNTTERFEKNIFPSLRSWHPEGQPYYVVMSNSWKPRYEDLVRSHVTFKKFSLRIEPLWVDCEDNAMDATTLCCKQESGIVAMLDNFIDTYDFLFFSDDNNYVRAAYLQKYLATQDANAVFVMTEGPKKKTLGFYGVAGQNVEQYKCSREVLYQYPIGQALIYSKGALNKIEQGLRLGGLTKQCTGFGVGRPHGAAIFHWMYEIPEKWNRVSKHCATKRADYFGCHGVGIPMISVHKKYETDPALAESPFDLDFFRRMPWRVRKTKGGSGATAFSQTETFKQFGQPSTWEKEWHTMPISDCLSRSLNESSLVLAMS
jgi:hypothetical protein